MTNEEKINVLKHRVIYLQVLKDKADALGANYTDQATEIQAKITEKEAQIAELET